MANNSKVGIGSGSNVRTKKLEPFANGSIETIAILVVVCWDGVFADLNIHNQNFKYKKKDAKRCVGCDLHLCICNTMYYMY